MLFEYCDAILDSDLDLGLVSASSYDGEPAFWISSIREESMPDASIFWFHQILRRDGTPWLSVAKNDSGYLMRIHDIADFYLSSDSKKISYCFNDYSNRNTIIHLLLDHILPMAISNQGRLVLHASAVSYGGESIAFIGESGAGKSSLAGALLKAGCSLITDDFLILEKIENAYFCIPSYPDLRLWPDSADSLFNNLNTSEFVSHFSDKRRIRVKNFDMNEFSGKTKLKRIYILGGIELSVNSRTETNCDDYLISEVTTAQYFGQALKSVFRLDISDHSRIQSEFAMLSDLISGVAGYRLHIPRRISWLLNNNITLLNTLFD